MTEERSSSPSRVSVAACAVLMAASVAGAGAGGSLSTTGEAHAIEQIRRYCAVSFRNAQIRRDEWTDCTQETLAELLRRIPSGSLPVAITNAQSEERRELNRSIWCAIQRHRRAHRPLQLDGDPADTLTSVAVGSFDENDALDAALADLSQRQRQIVTLWSQGWSVADVAEELALPAARVSDEKYKALRKLRQALDAAEQA